MPLRHSVEEEEERHERWMVSYADFITLLFAFFVVMYSVSSVNDGKYRVLTDSLGSAFREPLARLMPIDMGGGAPLTDTSMEGGEGGVSLTAFPGAANELEEAALDPVPTQGPATHAAETPGLNIENAEDAGAYLREHLAGMIDDDRFEVRQDEQWLQIELNSELLFQSGSADIAPAALAVIDDIAPVLRSLPGEIRVQGFTDDRPIASARFPSNWELSAARAGSIVRRFAQTGVEPTRLSAVGFGEHRPVADNKTEDGRRTNRRVVIAVAAIAELTDAVAGAEPGRVPMQASREAGSEKIVLQRVSDLPGPIGVH
jgi:chemotaxis protein MotB